LLEYPDNLSFQQKQSKSKIMRILFAYSFLMFVFSAYATTNAQPTLPTYDISIFHKHATLTAGTTVFFEATEEINSDEMTEGQLVQFKVKNDVYANNKVVIRSGAPAMGRVKKIEKSTYNNPEKITMEVTQVQAVDGQQINLAASEQTLKGKFSGEGSTMKSGTLIAATVLTDMKIRVK
jgi:hypothetical protein